MTKTTTAAVYVKRVLAFAVCLLWGLALKAETPNSDDINDVILVEGSVPVKWTNDATYPWELTETEIVTPLISENDKTCTLTGTYTSAYPTEIKFDWYRNWYSYSEKIEIYVDDELYSSIRDSSWRAKEPFLIPAGTHVLKFVNYSGDVASRSAADGIRGGLRNLRIWQCKELESSCLTSKSMPLTFKNDPEHMWITEDGYIRSNASNVENYSSSISTTFTIDKYSKLSFNARMGYYYENSNNLVVNIDGEFYVRIGGDTDWHYESVVLAPGEHTVEFVEWHSGTHQGYWAQISNIELHQDWIDVTVANAGNLGREILYKVENLQDVELLKISGPLNEADWSVISQLTNAKAIDMLNAQIDVIPDNAFYGKSYLSTVFMPEGVKKIGGQAFRGTRAYHYTVPASVERIELYAWYDTPLQKIDFAEGSVLNFIGYEAFYSCDLLKEFIMPDSVTQFGVYNDDYRDGYCSGHQFWDCTSLKKLHISDSATYIPAYFAYNCTQLSDLHLPASVDKIYYNAFQNTYALNEVTLPENLKTIGGNSFSYSGLVNLVIPESVTTIGGDAFRDNKALEHLTLNSHCYSFASNVFANCTALKTIICPVATPPINESYPSFNGVNLGGVKLIVPDFALEDYKQDSYWYNFIVEAGDEASVRDYWYIGNGLTLDKGKRIRNTPEVVMATGSSIWIDGEGAQPFGKFTYGNEEGYPTSFLSQTDAVTATELVNRFWIDSAEKWFFFSPVTDVNFADITNTTTDSWVIRRYNGERRASQNTSSGNWQNVTEGKLLRGEGYIVRANKTGWLVMPVAKENHQQFFGAAEATLPINAYACEDQPANANWNFMGNPYPTCFDIHDMDMEAPITVWTGSTYKALSLSDDRYVLRPMQPFFVQKPEECESLAMLRDGKQLTTTPSNKKVRRRAPETGRDLINLSIRMEADTVEADMTRVVVNERATAGYDAARDASKFMSLDLATAQIYTFDNAGQQMAINERPYGEGSVRLGVYLPKRGAQYVISADRADRDAYIYDSVTGLEHSFEYGPYTFTADTEGLCNDRFILGFAPGQSTGAEGLGEDEVKVIALRGAIEVAAPAGTEVAVYGADGLKAASFTASEGRMTVPVQAGVYVVTVAGESRTVIVK